MVADDRQAASSAYNVAALLARSAATWPRLPALARGARVECDYATLARRAAGLAEGLRRRGCQAGDRVLLVAANQPDYLAAMLGAWWLGLVVVPVNARLHPAECAWVAGNAGARIAFVDAHWGAALAVETPLTHVFELGGREFRALDAGEGTGPPAPVRADDAAWLFYTSGTTGRPKGVVITHANLRAMTAAYLASVSAIEPGDAIVHAAPLSHGSGLYAIPHLARAAAHVLPESGRFDPDEIVAIGRAWHGIAMFAAPTMIKRLVGSASIGALRHDNLKCVIAGGGPFYVADILEAYRALDGRLAQIYGQGESPMTITAMDRALLADAVHRNDLHRLASVGVAQFGMELRIAGDDGAALPVGTAGEVLVRGPAVMQGYWANPEATARTLAGGWLHTGDVGLLDADGFLVLKDRSRDLVISGGSNIYPREVEEALLTHPDVAEAAVIGRPHPEWGEELLACIVPRAAGDADAQRRLEAALDAHCLASIARFKRPRAYVFLDALPKNETGKVLKTVLRERHGAAR